VDAVGRDPCLARMRWRALLVGVPLSLASVGTSWVTAEPAAARCEARNVPIVMAVPNATNPRATETPAAGTCNGNGTYSGALRDAKPGDGFCANLAIYDHRGGEHYVTIENCSDTHTAFIEWPESDGLLYFVLYSGGYSARRFNSGF
jgi:hypothetical protein